MKVNIRTATQNDFMEVFHLIHEFATFIKTPEKVKITPEQMIENQAYFKCLVAEREEKIVGFATYFYAYYSWTGKAIYLDDLFVIEAYRGQGIGTKLFDRIVEMGKQENCYKMRWQVPDWNFKSQEFYKRKGANIDDVEINCELVL